MTEYPRLIGALTGNGITGTLARGAGAALLVRIVSVLLNFGFHLVLARAVGITTYGEYAYAFSWAMIVAFIGRAGLQNTAVRYISRYQASKSWSLLRGLRRSTLIAVVLVSAGTSALSAAVLWMLGFYYTGAREEALYVSFLIAPLFAILALKEGFLRGLKKPAIALVGDGIVRPALAALAVFVLSASGRALDTVELLGITGLAAAFGLAFAGHAARRAWPIELSGAAADTGPSREWYSFGLTLLWMGGMSLIHTRADTIMLGLLSTSAEVGLYTAASRYGLIMVIPLQAVNLVAAPMISASYYRTSSSDTQQIASISSLLITLSTTPIALGLIIYGSELLGLFGQEFEAGMTALTWIVLGQLVNALSGSVAFLLTMTKHQTAAALCAALAALVNIGLNFALVPRFGASGAAFATGCSIVVQNLSMLWVVAHSLQIDPTLIAVLRRLMSRAARGR